MMAQASDKEEDNKLYRRHEMMAQASDNEEGDAKCWSYFNVAGKLCWRSLRCVTWT